GGVVGKLTGKVGGKRGSENGRAFRVEVDSIRLVIVSRQHGGVYRDQRFHASSSRSQRHFVNGILRRRSRRHENDEFRAVGCTQAAEALQAGICNGVEFRLRWNGRLRPQELEQLFAV